VLAPVRTPSIVITGLRRAGLNLVGDMLRAGFVPPERIIVAPDPHLHDRLELPAPLACGLYVDRTIPQLLASIARERGRQGAAPISPDEHRILKRQFTRHWRRARDAAAHYYDPLFIFQHADIVDDPEKQARRLANIVTEHYVRFSARLAALAVRRIYNPPRYITGTFRVVKS